MIYRNDYLPDGIRTVATQNNPPVTISKQSGQRLPHRSITAQHSR